MTRQFHEYEKWKWERLFPKETPDATKIEQAERLIQSALGDIQQISEITSLGGTAFRVQVQGLVHGFEATDEVIIRHSETTSYDSELLSCDFANAASANRVTGTTTANHNFGVGDFVDVRGTGATYDGSFQVLKRTNTTFEFEHSHQGAAAGKVRTLERVAWTVADLDKKTITGIANPGGGRSEVTTNGDHDLRPGDSVRISGTVNYNGVFRVGTMTATTFEIDRMFTAIETAGEEIPANAFKVVKNFQTVTSTNQGVVQLAKVYPSRGTHLRVLLDPGTAEERTAFQDWLQNPSDGEGRVLFGATRKGDRNTIRLAMALRFQSRPAAIVVEMFGLDRELVEIVDRNQKLVAARRAIAPCARFVLKKLEAAITKFARRLQIPKDQVALQIQRPRTITAPGVEQLARHFAERAVQGIHHPGHERAGDRDEEGIPDKRSPVVFTREPVSLGKDEHWDLRLESSSSEHGT